MPLELKQQRILSGVIAGTLYRYTVRRINAEDWLAYFDSVLYEQQLVDGAVVNTSDSTAARLELLRKVLLNVDGYGFVSEDVETGHEQGKPLTEITNWQDLLPVSHRIAFADLLFECGLDTSAAAPAMLGAELVTLRCRWTGSADGKSLVEYKGLKHIFTTPSIEHLREYSRDSSRSRIVGGRKGKTQFLGAQRTLVKLYDQLIQRVEGYSVDGTPLDKDRDLIVATMDTFHKAQAMGHVFAPADADSFSTEGAE